MAAKLNTTKTISMKNGSMGPNGSGKTVPGPGNVKGGGQTAAQANSGGKGGGGQNTGGSGYGRASGIQSGRGRMGGC